MNDSSPNRANSASDLIEFARLYGPADVNYEESKLTALSGDAGFRRYYRLSSQPSLMLVDSPPEQERNLEYVRISDFLAVMAVRVPRIHGVSFEQGLFVIEDLGDRLLQNELSEQTAPRLYQRALDMLLGVQCNPSRPSWVEDYSDQLLLDELCLFPEWFLEKLLGVNLNADTKSLLKKAFSALVDSAGQQPQVLVHRDFHSRNLMLVDGDPIHDELAVIDFQDAVWGPVTYDLVSLCRDCYLRWPDERVTQISADYAQRLVQSGLLSEDQLPRFPRWFDLMGLQRHIKVLGIFARLYLRDGKSNYLNDLPLVLRYVLEQMSRYEAFSELHGWLVDEVVPVAEQQSWYQDWQTAGKQLPF